MKIVIASGKGGTGKTSIATSLFFLIDNAIYVDLDVEEPDGKLFLNPEIVKTENFNLLIPEINPEKCNYCKKCAEACVHNAITILPKVKKVMFFKDLCHNCGVCKYVCPIDDALIEIPDSKGIINYGFVKKQEIAKNKNEEFNFVEGVLNLDQPTGVPLIQHLHKKFENNKNILIMDAPPGTSCPVVAAIEPADLVIVVLEPTPFGINDFLLMLELLKNLNKKYYVVVNKYEPVVENDINELSKKYKFEIIGKIPYSVEIAKYYSKGKIIALYSDEIKGKFKKILNKIWK